MQYDCKKPGDKISKVETYLPHSNNFSVVPAVVIEI